MLQTLRLNYGLRWAGKYPPMMKASIHLAIVMALWIVASSVDYQIQQAQAKEQFWSSQLADCLNGTWRGRTESGEEIGCYPAETNKRRQG